MRLNQYLRLCLALGMLLPCLMLSSCALIFMPAVKRYGEIHETMTPRSILQGREGNIGIKVDCTYYRLKDSPWNAKQIPLSLRREGYVDLGSEWIKDQISLTTHSAGSIISIKYVDIRNRAHMNGQKSQRIIVLPTRFDDPNPQFPLDLCNAGDVQEYQPNERVPYPMGNEIVYLDFSKVHLASRSQKSWWKDIAYGPAMVGDIAITGGVIAAGIMLAPVILAVEAPFMIFAGIRDSIKTKCEENMENTNQKPEPAVEPPVLD